MRRATVLTAALTLAVGAVAAPASAATTDEKSPWIRYHQEDVTVAAGKGCDFEVFEKVLRDGEYYRDVATYADGTPRIQQWKGPLVMRYTNTATGKSIVVDLDGKATITYYPDGGIESLTIANGSGHFGSTIPDGSNLPRGVYRFGGKWTTLKLNEDGTRRVDLGPKGTAENLCTVLAG